MTMYSLISPGGSPGVTTTALALALTWPRPVIVAECDPGGGSVLAGLFAGHLTAPRGLLGVAFEAGRGQAAVAAELSGQLVPLDESRTRRLLAGISDPRQAPGLSPVWPAIAAGLASQSADVLADCGRLDVGANQPVSVLAESAIVVMVLRPTLRQVAAARPRVEMVAQLHGDRRRVGLVLIGDKGLRSGEIAKALDTRVLATIPLDEKTAAVLSDGTGRRSGIDRRPLMRAAQTAGVIIGRANSGTSGPELVVPSRRAE
ncbi:MAG TPA: hypothetical protein VMA95_02435 [Streptosporangiaceae bacterium]|nr:hypothetical protein [Streptosporangiaceae bacterium]